MRSAELVAFVLACASLGCLPPRETRAPDAGTADGGGTSRADAGARPSADPCGVVGRWWNGCGEVALCGPCAGASLPLGVEFSIEPAVAAHGGTFDVGSTPMVFDVTTCTLSTAHRFCSPWTDDRYTLRDGQGTGAAYGHCAASGSICDCEVATTCTPVRLP